MFGNNILIFKIVKAQENTKECFFPILPCFVVILRFKWEVFFDAFLKKVKLSGVIVRNL